MTHRRTVTAEAGVQTIGFTREFDASAARVFQAHTDAGLLAQWVGPRGTSVRMREFDPRTGGSWSYVVAGGDGEYGFHGSFHEVTAPRRIVQTFEFDGNPGHVSLELLTFTDLAEGRSRIEGLSVFGSTAERDAMLADMDSGMDDNFERLDELLAATAVS